MFDPQAAVDDLRNGWAHPTVVFPILLLAGSGIVQKALAQLAGGLMSPVAFSFGKLPSARSVVH